MDWLARKLRTWLTAPVVAATAAWMATACALSDDARAVFATAHYCPRDRITVTERPDMKHLYFSPGYEMPPPPADIQADPERLALYVEEAKKQRRPSHTSEDPDSYYEVKGCGDTALYTCASRHRKKCTLLP